MKKLMSRPEPIDALQQAGFGILPDGWSIQEIGDLLSSGRGISVGVMYPGDDTPGGVPLIKVSDLIDNRINSNPTFSISQEKHYEYRRTELKGGELLLTLVGAYLGQSAVVPPEYAGWNTARAVGVIPIRSEIGSRWVHLCLRSQPLQHIIWTRCTTTAQPTLNIRDVAQLPIPLPPPKERQRITDILGTLDDKIECNRRMNETLEAMARTLFGSWFVDFDPVRIKSEGRQPEGMDAQTAGLFPDSFELSSLGPIPMGWSVGKFNDVAALSREGIDPGDFPIETFDHYSIPAFDEGRVAKTETGEEIKSNKFVVVENAVLLSKLNPRIERVWVPDVNRHRRSVCSTEFLVLQARLPFSREWLVGLVRGRTFQEVFVSLVTGTSGSHQRVKPESLLGLDVVIPEENIVRRYTDVIGPIQLRIAANTQETVTLTATRDALLPKLLSGEVRVSGV